MGVKSMKKLMIFVVISFSLLGGGCFAEKSPVLVLWDDAIIGDQADNSRAINRQFIYSSILLRSGDKFTVLVPMDPGYRVLCCVEVAQDRSMMIEDLANTYANDKAFLRRLKSIQGVRYVYSAKFSSEKDMNPAMKRLFKGSGDTYFSAPALLGATRAERLDGNGFNWADWGRVTLNFRLTNGGLEMYQLHGAGKSFSISVESLSD